MATHSSILTWRIPWTEGPSGLQSMGSQRVGHGWVTNTFTFTTHTLGNANLNESLHFIDATEFYSTYNYWEDTRFPKLILKLWKRPDKKIKIQRGEVVWKLTHEVNKSSPRLSELSNGHVSFPWQTWLNLTKIYVGQVLL